VNEGNQRLLEVYSRLLSECLSSGEVKIMREEIAAVERVRRPPCSLDYVRRARVKFHETITGRVRSLNNNILFYPRDISNHNTIQSIFSAQGMGAIPEVG